MCFVLCIEVVLLLEVQMYWDSGHWKLSLIKRCPYLRWSSIGGSTVLQLPYWGVIHIHLFIIDALLLIKYNSLALECKSILHCEVCTNLGLNIIIALIIEAYQRSCCTLALVITSDLISDLEVFPCCTNGSKHKFFCRSICKNLIGSRD
jgi:tryptophan-rich sensory protein